MSLTPSNNTWYSLRNKGADSYLGGGTFTTAVGGGSIYLVSGGVPLWQFTDSQISDGHTWYAARMKGNGHYNGTDYCMITEGTVPVLKPCSSSLSSHFWFAFARDGGYYYINQFLTSLAWKGEAGELSMQNLNNVDNSQWQISAVSAINDMSWSSITYGYAKSTGSYSTTTPNTSTESKSPAPQGPPPAASSSFVDDTGSSSNAVVASTPMVNSAMPTSSVAQTTPVAGTASASRSEGMSQHAKGQHDRALQNAAVLLMLLNLFAYICVDLC